jgi:ATP-dependent DNA helicase RecG
MLDMRSAKLESLRRILEHERAGGFLDSAVIGGLDLFLQRWAGELGPALGALSSYSVLTPPQRASWVKDVLTRLGRATAPSAGGEPRAAREQSTPPPAKRKRASKKIAPPVGLSDGVARLKGVSTQSQVRLKRLDVETVEDLLYLIPNRHNDFANTCKVSELELGKDQTVVVTVWEASETRQGPKRRSTQAVLGDDTGNVRAIWFNNPYLARTFRTGTHLVISGKVNVFRGRFVFESPEYELLTGQEELVHTGRLVPVYPTVDRLPQRTLRRLVKRALDVGIPLVVDYVPEDSRHRTGLMGLRNAIAQAHYPDTAKDWEAARRRLAFDEMLLLQLTVLTRKLAWQREEEGIPLKVETGLIDGFLASLPFDLTAAQTRVLNEILAELREARPMSRLIQGDVGSGKTVVAAAAMLVAAFNGYQGAIMAPTEILAEQHFLTITHLLSGVLEVGHEDNLVSVQVGSFPRAITIGLLLGSLPKKVKEDMHRRIADGRVDLVIGTHALIQEDVDLSRLALAVVDEQHRFGVMQRASIRGVGRRPHLLAMSATPIPRSLALTVYGDLDISVIDQMPPGRQLIRTRWVEPARRTAAYSFVAKEVKQGRQAFIVCPLIEESEAIQTRAATVEYDRLSRDVFPDLRLGLLHGRMALREKEQVMELFQKCELDILVSTPVVEVGIDVPNATVMLIDGADRFGLAQLHQFRGRVGRGRHQSYCLLLADSPGEEARERLKLVERIHDGFELAEEDLRLRGPGDYLGTRQSGLPKLRVARITDHDILSLARQEAIRILDADPDLTRGENALLAEQMVRFSAGFTGEMS